MDSDNPTLCLFGTYESRFPRTLTLKKAAEINGYGLVECHAPFWEKFKDKQIFFSPRHLPLFLLRLTALQLKLGLRYLIRPRSDVLILGYNGYFDVVTGKILSRLKRAPLVFTPVFPLYETLVEDRKYMNRKSLRSKMIHKLDELGTRLADAVIIETQTYLEHYHEEFHVPREKLFRIPLGADEQTFFPRPGDKDPTGPFKVLFYGKFIPLQGIATIVRAAKILESDPSLGFEIIGSGQLSREIHGLAENLQIKNIDFIDWVDYSDLPRRIAAADVCLGIFGDTPKANRGIPIKVYEALAMKKPVITGNSSAAREVFIDGVNGLLPPMADPKALAEAVLRLKNDKKLLRTVAEGGHKLYHEMFSSARLAENLKTLLDTLLKNRGLSEGLL